MKHNDFIQKHSSSPFTLAFDVQTSLGSAPIHVCLFRFKIYNSDSKYKKHTQIWSGSLYSRRMLKLMVKHGGKVLIGGAITSQPIFTWLSNMALQFFEFTYIFPKINGSLLLLFIDPTPSLVFALHLHCICIASPK